VTDVAGSPTLPAPDARSLGGWLAAARAAGASDLHVTTAAAPFVRIEGELRSFDVPPTTAEEAAAIHDEVRALAHAPGTLRGEASSSDLDVCVDVPGGGGRVRVNLHRHARGPGASMKLVPTEILDLARLGLPETLYALTEFRVGLVLVTGPSNSGKTSTLAALLDRVNSTRKDHVVTIEDPIEFVFRSALCNVTQRQVGPHSRSFASALRASLREDPDVILVSELRDLDTIRTAIVAAETGHLVLGTLHTIDAASTLNRILDVFPPKEQKQIQTMLAGSLRAIVSQRLLPPAGGGRRVPGYEILVATPAVASLIRDGRTNQLASVLQTGRRLGMIDFDARLEELLAQGRIDRVTAARHAKNPQRFGNDEADASRARSSGIPRR
jgi:twitching motility protein PilT